MSHSEIALATFHNPYNCSQAVFSAYAEELGLDRDTALKISTGFGGGMSRMAITCGAVTGSFMVLGLKYGMANPADQAAKEKTYALVQEFARQFRARYGAIDCRSLLGYDIGTPEGMQAIREQQLFDTRCRLLVRAATEILDQLLETA